MPSPAALGSSLIFAGSTLVGVFLSLSVPEPSWLEQLQLVAPASSETELSIRQVFEQGFAAYSGYHATCAPHADTCRAHWSLAEVPPGARVTSAFIELAGDARQQQPAQRFDLPAKTVQAWLGGNNSGTVLPRHAAAGNPRLVVTFRAPAPPHAVDPARLAARP